MEICKTFANTMVFVKQEQKNGSRGVAKHVTAGGAF